MSNSVSISLIGNPNSGKSTLFNALTGAKQHVGNWPGVTVEKKTGLYTFDHHSVEVVDLPGTYAIEPQKAVLSQDELVVQQFLSHDTESIIVNIIDASNLQRNLFLTFQLMDMNRPMIVVLTMVDIAKMKGLKIDTKQLSEKLDCPVIAVSSKHNIGIETLKKTIIQQRDIQQSNDKSNNSSQIPKTIYRTLNNQQETIIQDTLNGLDSNSTLRHLSRAEFIEILLSPSSRTLTPQESERVQICREKLSYEYEGEIDIAIASSRYEMIDLLYADVVNKTHLADKTLTNKVDKFVLGKITGIPFFLFMMFLMFVLSINFGSAFIDFFEISFGTIFVDGTAYLLESVNSPDWLVTILANGIGTGIQTVATFIPVIAAMFLCLSFLEDSGYLARAAMIVDRGMRMIGLPGKAFVPMLVGFGCNVPAIMGTRTLENNRDRLMSIMMIPYMSCGARLPVYALFAATFFPNRGGFIVYMLYLFGILIAILTGLALKHSILKGTNTPFIMELPPYHLPTLKGLLLLTWDKLKGFILRAGKAIILMVTVLSILNSIGTDGSFGHEDSDNSVLSHIGQKITPAFKPMGINEENWPATVGIFTGIFAKEAVIGTLNSLYLQMGINGEKSEEDNFDFWGGINEALATIPANLSDAFANLFDPLGFKQTIADGDLDAIQKELSVDTRTVTQIQKLFGSESAVIAYLIFILLYTPCAAALGAVYRETGTKWTILVAVWSFVLAWICATGYYQFSLLSSDSNAIFWLVGLTVFTVSIFIILRIYGDKNADISLPTPTSREKKGGCC